MDLMIKNLTVRNIIASLITSFEPLADKILDTY